MTDAMAAQSTAGAGAILLPRRCHVRWSRRWASAFSTSFEGLVCTNAGRVVLMAYHLNGDELYGDARWSKLAEGADGATLSRRRWEDRVDALQAAYGRIQGHSAHQQDDGYVEHRKALELCRGRTWILEALTTPACGKGPFIHQRGETCAERNCIDASPPWTEGYEYRICGFLKRNPSRKEKARNDAQKRDLNDPALRAYLFDRDGGCCRYCRSGPMKPKGMGNAKDRRRIPVVEHIDPDRDAGLDRSNAVLACAACNEFKGRRTPDEAGMVLLPVPTTEQLAYWQARGEQQLDRPDPGQPSPADTVPDNAADKPADKPPDNAETSSQTTSRGVVLGVVHGLVSSVVDAPTPADVSAGGAQDNGHDNAPEGSGSGRVGQPPVGLLSGPDGQPIRTPDAPDIYHHRSRAPEPRAGPP